jgi:hypothetical protein
LILRIISNFNNGANLQGIGTTIVQFSPEGTVNLFAQIDPGTGAGRCPASVTEGAPHVVDQATVLSIELEVPDEPARPLRISRVASMLQPCQQIVRIPQG